MKTSSAISYQIPHLFNGHRTIHLYSHLITLLGPNGTGKTQTLESLITPLKSLYPNKNIRYVTAGRLSIVESHRTDTAGNHRHEGLLPKSIKPLATFGYHFQGQNHHHMSGIAGDIFALALKPDLLIKVRTRLRSLFRKDISLEWQVSGLSFKYRDIDANNWKQSQYDSSDEASGLLHVTAMLSALYNDELSVLLIDEPEISLHSQLQSFLIREISDIAGDPNEHGKKLIILSTHSPYMVKLSQPTDLASCVLFTDPKVAPVQISPDDSEWKRPGMKALFARMGESHRQAFFSKRILLVEGPSDEIICNTLASRCAIPLAAAGVQVVPVIGKGEMINVRKAFTKLGKACTILTDLDSIADDGKLLAGYYGDTKLDREVSDSDSDFRSFSDRFKTDLNKLIDDQNEYQKIDGRVSLHPYWQHKDNGKPDCDRVARRRATLAILLGLKAEESACWETELGAKWCNAKLRLTNLLRILSTVGCFVLNKGTIEEYYFLDKDKRPAEKPYCAAMEGEQMLAIEESSLEERYADILNALLYVSQIDRAYETEVSLLKEVLLSIASPLLARCKRGTTTKELCDLALDIAGEKAGFLQIENASREEGETFVPAIKVSIKSNIIGDFKTPIIIDRSNLFDVL